ncbi:hypothetical protein Nepgr_005304 [Nepenthes gracilis]|uniref:Uncharacterized protein n=1 Tax=Nepenthes gracilis TaxID=150966 RepID=A0AAD3XG89_NEPGR|nr:hypothetical protein Nepgr_005304 [Nepenthes gracilis]
MDYVISGCPTTMKDCTGGLMQLLIVSLGVVWKNPHVADVSTVRAIVGSCYRLLMLLLEVDGLSLAAGAVNVEACRGRDSNQSNPNARMRKATINSEQHLRLQKTPQKQSLIGVRSQSGKGDTPSGQNWSISKRDRNQRVL